MSATLFALFMIATVAGVLMAALAHFFAIVAALGMNRRWGIASLFVPLLAFYVCYRYEKLASFPLRMALISLGIAAIGAVVCSFTVSVS